MGMALDRPIELEKKVPEPPREFNNLACDISKMLASAHSLDRRPSREKQRQKEREET